MKRIIWIQTDNRFSDFGDDDLPGFEYFMSMDLENTLITSFILWKRIYIEYLLCARYPSKQLENKKEKKKLLSNFGELTI